MNFPFPSLAMKTAMLAAGCLSFSLYAQENQEMPDVSGMTEEQLAVEGDKALSAGNAEFANAAFTELIDRYTPVEGKAKFGTIFGTIIYGRASARMQLEDIDGAIEDYGLVVKEFPENNFSKMSLLMMANALLFQEKYDEALAQMEAYEKATNDREKAAAGYELIYRIYASAYLGLGKHEEAKPFIEALSGLNSLPNGKPVKPQSGLVMNLFLQYAEFAVEKGQFDDLRKLTQSIRAWSVNRPHELFTARSGLFELMRKVEAANAKENLDLSLLLLGLVPQEQQIRDSVEMVAGSLPESHPQANLAIQVLAELDRFANEKDPYDVTILFYQASLLQRAGESNAALGIYQYLLEAFPQDVKLRSQIIYSTVTAALQAGNFSLVQDYADQFSQEFPNDQQFGPQIRKYSLESVFATRNYAEALELGRQVRAAAQDGSEEAQLSDFVISGSLYYLNRLGEAQAALADWMETYGKSEDVDKNRKEFVSFAQLDLLNRNFQWAQLVPRSEVFLAEFPQAIPVRLGQAYLYKATGQNRMKNHDQANKTLEELKLKPEAYEPLRDRALILQGEVLSALEDKQQALVVWKEAIDVAQGFLNDSVGAQGLYLIIATFAQDEEMRPEVIAAFERFIGEDKFKDTQFYPSVAVAASGPLVEAGRLNDALQALEESMIKIRPGTGFDAMGKPINAYCKAFLSTVEDGEVPVRLERVIELETALEGIATQAAEPSLRAAVLLEMANRFRVVEQDAAEGSDEGIEAGVRVRATFAKLDRDFDPKDLDPEAILSLAEYLFAEQDFARAMNYHQAAFEGATQANNTALLPKASVGYGKSLIQQGRAEDAQKAIEILTPINEENYPNADAQHGDSLFFQAQANGILQKWEEALALCRQYIDGPWTTYGTDAHFQFAEILDKRLPGDDNKNAAIAMYQRIVNLYGRDFRVSIPSLKREIELRLDRNQERALVFQRLETAHASYDPSMNQATLFKAGYSPAETAELLGLWAEIEGMLEDLRP